MKVDFKLDKNLDKEMIGAFLGLQQGGLNFSGCVLNPNPKLRKILEKDNINKQKAISEYVDDVYKERKEILIRRVKEFNQRWSRVDRLYFNLIKEIFKIRKLPNHKYVGYLSIINCGPRFLEDRSFQVFYRRPKDSMYVAMHEILHFFFYDYVFKNYSEFKKLDPNKGTLWHLAEIFNSVILAESRFKKIHKQKRDWSYPVHKKHLVDFKRYWRELEDIDEWIKKSFNRIKDLTF